MFWVSYKQIIIYLNFSVLSIQQLWCVYHLQLDPFSINYVNSSCTEMKSQKKTSFLFDMEINFVADIKFILWSGKLDE